jgi:hypothetical protein
MPVGICIAASWYEACLVTRLGSSSSEKDLLSYCNIVGCIVIPGITLAPGIMVLMASCWNIQTVRPIERMKSGMVRTKETLFQML